MQGAGAAGPGHRALAGGVAFLCVIWGEGLGADRIVAAFLRRPGVVAKGPDPGAGVPGHWLMSAVSRPAHVLASQLLVLLDCSTLVSLVPSPSSLSTVSSLPSAHVSVFWPVSFCPPATADRHRTPSSHSILFSSQRLLSLPASSFVLQPGAVPELAEEPRFP